MHDRRIDDQILNVQVITLLFNGSLIFSGPRMLQAQIGVLMGKFDLNALLLFRNHISKVVVDHALLCPITVIWKHRLIVHRPRVNAILRRLQLIIQWEVDMVVSRPLRLSDTEWTQECIHMKEAQVVITYRHAMLIPQWIAGIDMALLLKQCHLKNRQEEDMNISTLHLRTLIVEQWWEMIVAAVTLETNQDLWIGNHHFVVAEDHLATICLKEKAVAVI